MRRLTESRRYVARSASDRTDEWPFWYIADRLNGDLNVTIELLPEMRGGLPFLSRSAAEGIAEWANNDRRALGERE